MKLLLLWKLLMIDRKAAAVHSLVQKVLPNFLNLSWLLAQLFCDDLFNNECNFVSLLKDKRLERLMSFYASSSSWCHFHLLKSSSEDREKEEEDVYRGKEGEMRRQSDGTRQAARNRKQRAKGATAMVVMMMRYPTGFWYRLMYIF